MSASAHRRYNPASMMITSPQNPRIKLARALLTQRKARYREQRCALEGARLVGDALDAGAVPDFALFTAGFAGSDLGPGLLEALRAAGADCLEVDPALMDALPGVETPPGILAVCPLPALDPPAHPTLALVVDRLADPGNLGAILRTASAAGVALIALAPGTVDPYNPKTLRAGMGAHFRAPVVFMKWEALPPLPLVLAEADATTDYTAFDWTQPAALVIGGEAHGFSQQARQRATTRVRIPMARATESLNAAAAAAVILFEARRQREAAERA